MNPLTIIFDVESVGLHGEGFAVAGGIYDSDRKLVREFAFHCPIEAAEGRDSDRKWVADNVAIPAISILCENPFQVRWEFWRIWMSVKAEMWVECGWPVEANFLAACVQDCLEERGWQGPYPLHEIASVMKVSGMEPIATYERKAEELPAHNPLADARQSARLLFEAQDRINQSKIL